MKLFLKKNKRFKVRKEINKFLYLPIYHRGNLFWLTKIKMEKTFNGITMRIVNIQKI
ncbi:MULTISPECIES: hypothetical protein [Tenacibaculum]|uniref:hypothetical protein n=1 Tax=Tenacibaculum TaxID=104267 RepID=UPI00089BA61C|nr:hypothetical protein [Tenacibaculum sp. MAR_2010_89]SEE59200.1 hypothetical protein SAMN04487765_3286 [Tenacibaculum sp. MAR_2010_89]